VWNEDVTMYEVFDAGSNQRLGYFCVDADSTEDNLVFNRTVPLRDSWSKKKNK